MGGFCVLELARVEGRESTTEGAGFKQTQLSCVRHARRH